MIIYLKINKKLIMKMKNKIMKIKIQLLKISKNNKI